MHPAPETTCYRNKAQYPVAVQKNRAYAGFFKAGTHQVIENDRCLILPIFCVYFPLFPNWQFI